MQRIASGAFVLRHVPDAECPADFMTKWIGRAKLDKSVAYVTNSGAAVEATPDALRSEAKAAMLAAMELCKKMRAKTQGERQAAGVARGKCSGVGSSDEREVVATREPVDDGSKRAAPKPPVSG